MKTTMMALYLATTITVLAGESGPAPEGGASAYAYDDRQIAMIRRGETSETRLLEWFGAPESRNLKPTGDARLSWGFDGRSDGGASSSGTLSVGLGPDGKVVSYTARRGPR